MRGITMNYPAIIGIFSPYHNSMCRNGISKRQKATFSTPALLRFSSSNKATEEARYSCNVYREGIIGESTARKWFAKFKNGDFGVDDTPRRGRPSEFNRERLKALLKEDGYQTSRELT
ncbi:hypothetical protein TNCV_3772811 [Trichonephila clavipes]|nr:hypothetical protein TNCV_3772811 [Trichonephila clavipes]